MENIRIFQFKTNINCGGCIASVKPHLNKMEGISSWEVDTTSKDKVLSVTPQGATKEQVIAAVTKAGFKIEAIN